MSEKISVVHFIPGLDVGGAERFLADLVEHGNRVSFTHHVFFWSGSGVLAGRLSAAGAEVRRLDLEPVIGWRSIFKMRQVLSEIPAPRLVHTHFMDADLLGGVASFLAGVPAVAHIHSFPFPVGWKHALRYSLLSLHWRAVLCVSGHVRDHLRRVTFIPQGKLKVAYNGIDLARFQIELEPQRRREIRSELGAGDEHVLIGNVSRLIPDKGQEFILRAAVLVLERCPRARFVVVGDGPLDGALRALAARLGVAHAVCFTGRREDVPELLAAMDVVALPTFREAFGLCLLEAMSAGRPCVAGGDAAFAEIAQDAADVLLVAPGNAQALAEALLRLVNDQALRDRLVGGGRLKVQEFSIQAAVRNLEEIYRQCL